MMTLVFNEKKREYHGPARDADTDFTHLDRSACSYSEIARRAVNRWFGEVTDACDSPGKRSSLLSYLKDAKRPNRFNEALLEIATLRLLSGIGHAVDVEPTFVQRGKRTPDYLLRAGNQNFLVECNVRRGHQQTEETQAVRQLWDWINENVNTHGYHLFISAVTWGEGNPIRRNLRRSLERRTQELKALGEDTFYGFEYSDKSGFELELSLHRANQLSEEHSAHSRSIGIYPGVGTSGNGSDLLEDAVSAKAHRYRDIQTPLIIVLGSGGIHAFDDGASLLQGMLGRNVFDDLGSRHISLLAADMTRTDEDRRIKAAFGYLTEPRNRNVSAVLYKPDFGLWSMGNEDWMILHNPFALTDHGMPTGLFPFAHEIFFDSKYRANYTAPSQVALDILGLPEGWPWSDECECSPYDRADLEAATERLFKDIAGEGATNQ